MSPYRVQQTLDPEPPALTAPDRESGPPDAPADSVVVVRPAERHDERGDSVATAFVVLGALAGIIVGIWSTAHQ